MMEHEKPFFFLIRQRSATTLRRFRTRIEEMNQQKEKKPAPTLSRAQPNNARKEKPKVNMRDRKSLSPESDMRASALRSFYVALLVCAITRSNTFKHSQGGERARGTGKTSTNVMKI
jgi:site-specific recombinase XerD